MGWALEAMKSGVMGFLWLLSFRSSHSTHKLRGGSAEGGDVPLERLVSPLLEAEHHSFLCCRHDKEFGDSQALFRRLCSMEPRDQREALHQCELLRHIADSELHHA